MHDILTLFSYSFMQRALLVGLLVAPCAALLGVSLVLRRYSMIGDGLSHVGFGALSLAFALNLAPLQVALPIVILAAFWLLHLSESSKMHGDSAIALISSAAIAFGVVVTSLTNGMSTDVYDLMFGSILAVGSDDLILSLLLSSAVLFVFIFFYRKIFAITFDEGFARTAGTNVRVYTSLIAFLTAVTIVVGMRIMGSMLISSLIIFPALTAMRLFRSFRSVTLCAAVLSLVAFGTGLLLSFWFSLPTGATIVLVNLGFFLLFSILEKLR
ncbi:MAG: metal ABC transporter permease [Clostridia bacterium]|nr:metal ABC transporter permease [Oscillospiraceae bacterium]MBQ7032350.1 metal ABC transporter permease [Clostridia bacterium]